LITHVSRTELTLDFAQEYYFHGAPASSQETYEEELMLTETQRADFINELAWTRVQIHDLVELEQLLRDQLVLDETKLQTAQYELAKQILVLAELTRHLGREAPMLRVQGKFTGTRDSTIAAL
jgi:hypothetical protein